MVNDIIEELLNLDKEGAQAGVTVVDEHREKLGR